MVSPSGVGGSRGAVGSGEARRGGWWDANKIGLSPTPIETPQGWLVIYHGVRQTPARCPLPIRATTPPHSITDGNDKKTSIQSCGRGRLSIKKISATVKIWFPLQPWCCQTYTPR